MAQQQFFYGGQAVIEGVMIRGRRVFSVAARSPEGEICTIAHSIPSLYTGPWRRVPLVRGTIVLLEMLVMGIQALTYSANVAAGGGETPISKWTIALTIALSLGFGIALFFVFPLLVVERAVDRFTDSSIVSNLAEGVLRLIIFLAYIKLIGLMRDIRRVFAYHAAEHMTVHAQEAQVPLDTSHIRRFPRAHPRCGTAFLLTVMVVAIIVFTMLGTPSLQWRLLSRILLIPVIAGLSYEVIRFSGAHAGSRLVKLFMAPSLALQALTTRPPDDDQIEVAISAMQTAISADQGTALDPHAGPRDDGSDATS